MKQSEREYKNGGRWGTLHTVKGETKHSILQVSRQCPLDILIFVVWEEGQDTGYAADKGGPYCIREEIPQLYCTGSVSCRAA